MAQFENILVEDTGRVRVITLNRTARKNAVNIALAVDIANALQEAAGDEGVGAVVITGQPEYFSAGVDLMVFTEVASGSGGDVSSITTINEALWNFPKPVIAAVEGIAVGMGVTLLPWFDMVYASDDATFKTPFVQLGLVLEYGSSFMLPRLIGRQRTNELILRAKPIDAATAERWGLVNRVFPKASFREEWMAIATDVAENPPGAVAKCRDLIRKGEEISLKEALNAEWEVLATCYGSEENLKAVTAFFSKGK